MIYQLQKTQQLNCTLQEAWHFFSSPDNLPLITPPYMQFTVISNLKEEQLYEGMTIKYKLKPLLYITVKWETLITEVSPEKSFTDIQLHGPYKLWKHQHQFIPNEYGVLMKDTVDYELPLGILGRITHSLIVRKKLEDLFNYRHKVVDEKFNH